MGLSQCKRSKDTSLTFLMSPPHRSCQRSVSIGVVASHHLQKPYNMEKAMRVKWRGASWSASALPDLYPHSRRPFCLPLSIPLRNLCRAGATPAVFSKDSSCGSPISFRRPGRRPPQTPHLTLPPLTSAGDAPALHLFKREDISWNLATAMQNPMGVKISAPAALWL